MFAIIVYSVLLAVSQPFVAAQIQLPPGFDPCIDNCASTLLLPAVGNCSVNQGSTLSTCFCKNFDLGVQLAECGLKVCPRAVVEDMYNKLANVCKAAGQPIPTSVALSTATLIVQLATSTTTPTNTTSSRAAASTSSSGSAGRITVQRTPILDWAMGAMAALVAI
ncbi:hypothetical protein BCR34DRAFT_590078 [Clohesyomyces aquaticus]|uniref:Extracellular membrane protein CFEM domain-containing protein n=1 Tax=Clohesyomyces aquaticus TaxID=1231657 RepID=A0A1Y1ZCP9_9PLEO|nr:hypothetical protein BCR34DRAFT_590078 [Clohesyomyces aquaticus]